MKRDGGWWVGQKRAILAWRSYWKAFCTFPTDNDSKYTKNEIQKRCCKYWYSFSIGMFSFHKLNNNAIRSFGRISYKRKSVTINKITITLLYVETHVWTCACVAKLTSSASCSWCWHCFMSKRTHVFSESFESSL